MTALSFTRDYPKVVVISGTESKPGSYYQVLDDQSDLDKQVVLCINLDKSGVNTLISITTGVQRNAVKSFILAPVSDIDIRFTLQTEEKS